MPRPVKKGKARAAKEPSGEPSNGASPETLPVSAAVAEPPPGEQLPPPPVSVETPENMNADDKPAQPKRRERPVQQKRPGSPLPVGDAEETPEPPQKPEKRGPQKGDEKDRIATTSLNIAKLQSMSMTELNQMARELSVE